MDYATKSTPFMFFKQKDLGYAQDNIREIRINKKVFYFSHTNHNSRISHYAFTNLIFYNRNKNFILSARLPNFTGCFLMNIDYIQEITFFKKSNAIFLV